MMGDNYEYVSAAINDLFRERYIERAAPSIENNAPLANALANLCQSEIEQRMLVELYFCDWYVVDWFHIEIHDPTDVFPPRWEEALVIAPQFEVKPYRLDFGLLFRHRRSGRILKIAIECDGHAFHERTKEQAEHDKKRDREIQKAGFMVFRFTGSEIFRKGQERAQEIADYCWKWWQEQSENA